MSNAGHAALRLAPILLCCASALAGGPGAGRATPAPGEGAAGDEMAAATIFARRCATCHGKDGRARTFKARFNKARDLTDAGWQAEVSDERLFNSITRGRGKMPSFGKKLSPAEVEALVAYVRGLKR